MLCGPNQLDTASWCYLGPWDSWGWIWKPYLRGSRVFLSRVLSWLFRVYLPPWHCLDNSWQTILLLCICFLEKWIVCQQFIKLLQMLGTGLMWRIKRQYVIGSACQKFSLLRTTSSGLSPVLGKRRVLLVRPDQRGKHRIPSWSLGCSQKF